jgi:hypothetical protein
MGELFEILPSDKEEIEIAKRLRVPLTLKVGKKTYRLARTSGIYSGITTNRKGALNIAKNIRKKKPLLAKVKEMKHIDNAYRYAVYFNGWWM